MTDADQQQQIAADVADIKALLQKQHGRLAVVEDWKVSHQQWADAQSLEISRRIERLKYDVLREITPLIQKIFEDAVISKLGEDFEDRLDRKFKASFEKMREEQSAERRKELKEMFGTIHKSTVWIQPLLQVATLLIGLYLFFGR